MANVEMRDTSLYLIILGDVHLALADLKTETQKLLLYLCNRYKWQVKASGYGLENGKRSY